MENKKNALRRFIVMGCVTYYNTNWHPYDFFGTPGDKIGTPPYKWLNRAILSYTICETLSSR
jgi:hypothetical protein